MNWFIPEKAVRHALVGLAPWGLGLLFGIQAIGQERIESIPLAGETKDFISERSDAFWIAESAGRALEAGLYEVALSYARDARAQMDGAKAELEERLRLIEIDALLGKGYFAEARLLTDELDALGWRSHSVALRYAVLALADENEEEAASYVTELGASDLDESEQAWLALVHGWLDLQSGDLASAQIEFDSARSLASRKSPALAGHIAFLAFRYRLESENADISVEELKEAYDESRGSESGFRYAQLLAVVLDESDRRTEAVDLIDEALAELPAVYLDLKDQFLLLKMILSGLDTIEGRLAARSLAIDGSEPLLQRTALQHIVSKGLDADSSSSQFLVETLDLIIEREPTHPLAAEALYYRGAQKFQEGDYLGVEEVTDSFMSRFPESEYKKGILTLSASSSWHRNRFRTAAKDLSEILREFSNGENEGSLRVLIADCLFRAGEQADNAVDFANAAAAYKVALNGPLELDTASNVFFQLTLSHLRANEIEEAKAILDDQELSQKLDPVMVWRAEWMLIKQMRRIGASSEAYDRIDSFVNLGGLSLSLQMRLLWLGGKLAFESGLYNETRVWVDRLDAVLDEVGETSFVAQVESNAQLTLAESLLELGETEEGLRILNRLRVEFEGSESAELSYIVEARHLSGRDLVVEASQLLSTLVDKYPNSKFAPLALYEGALNTERRGQGEYLNQAIERLESIARDYPDSDLVYFARLKQGDLLRKLNKFGPAEQVYRLVENTYRNRPDRYWAQISLADTLIAQASEFPSKFEAGISRLERLMDLPNVPTELRVEAGYKRGNAWKNHGDQLKAKAAYWDLYDLFVEEELRIQNLKRKGRYWLARAIFELAEIFEDQAELDLAIEFYEKIEELGLQGSAPARARIDQLRRGAPLAGTP